MIKQSPVDVYDAAHRAAVKIKDDLLDRSGVGNELEQIDPETQEEMFLSWVNIIAEEMVKLPNG
jgi:hypothetical protein